MEQAMNNEERQSTRLIRDRVIRGQASELHRLRVFVSSLDGEAADKLRDAETMLLERVTEDILGAMGYGQSQPKEARFSKTRRAANRMVKAE